MKHIPLVITSDFDCGNAHDITEVAPDHWQVRIHGDTIYGPWYYLELQETAGRQREVQLDVLDIPDLDAVSSQADRTVYQINGGSWLFLPFERAEVIHTGRTAIFEEPIVWFWERQEEVPENRLREMPAADLHLHLTIPPNARMRVATTYPFTYSNLLGMVDWLQHLPEPNRKLSHVEIIGHSEENRSIPMVTLTDPDIPRQDKQILLITARHHPSMESSGSWVAEGIIEFLTSGEPEAIALLRKLVVVIIPIVNVDGVVRGNPHYNINGIDLWMDYEAFKASETKTIFSVMDQLIPDFFIDWHGWICHHEGKPPYDGSYLDFKNSEPWDAASYQVMADYWKEHIYGFGTRDLYRSLFASCPIGTAYSEFHTLGTTIEINPGGYTIGQVKRRGLDNFIHTAEMMLRHWPGYPMSGTPNREIRQSGKVSLFAWGENFGEMRSSRVELWRKREAIEITVEEETKRRTVVKLRTATEVKTTAALRLPVPSEGSPMVHVNGQSIGAPEIKISDDFCFVPVALNRDVVTVEIKSGLG